MIAFGFLVMTGICAACIVKINLYRFDFRAMQRQLSEINRTPQTNERLQTSTQNKQMIRFAQEVNQLLAKLQSEKRDMRVKEKHLKQEITNVSHDLRTPLTSLRGYVDVLLSEPVTEEERMRYLRIIDKKVDHLISTVDLFYDISLLESEDAKWEMESVSLKDALEECLLLYFRDFEDRAVALDIRRVCDASVWSDEQMLARVLHNLLQNALKYAKTTVAIDIEERGDFVKLTVCNDTDLQEETALDSIFERTHTLDASRSDRQSGLGLYIVKRLMERQGGSVQASLQQQRFSIECHFRKRPLSAIPPPAGDKR